MTPDSAVDAGLLGGGGNTALTVCSWGAVSTGGAVCGDLVVVGAESSFGGNGGGIDCLFSARPGLLGGDCPCFLPKFFTRVEFINLNVGLLGLFPFPCVPLPLGSGEFGVEGDFGEEGLLPKDEPNPSLEESDVLRERSWLGNRSDEAIPWDIGAETTRGCEF